MSDVEALEHEILDTIGGAADEAALEAARVAALGKKGSISALLATLGKMPPEQRREQGPPELVRVCRTVEAAAGEPATCAARTEPVFGARGLLHPHTGRIVGVAHAGNGSDFVRRIVGGRVAVAIVGHVASGVIQNADAAELVLVSGGRA